MTTQTHTFTKTHTDLVKASDVPIWDPPRDWTGPRDEHGIELVIAEGWSGSASHHPHPEAAPSRPRSWAGRGPVRRVESPRRRPHD